MGFLRTGERNEFKTKNNQHCDNVIADVDALCRFGRGRHC
jgi:hypothetical protein